MPTRTRHGHNGHELAALPPMPPPDAIDRAIVDPAEVPLDETCQMLLAGIDARGREIQRAVLEPFNADVARANRLIERFCGVPEGAIGTTHELIAGNPPKLWRKPPADQPPAG